MNMVIDFFVFFVGACIFSFLNVIVYRLPRKMDYITGRSICPSCQHRLGFWDLIPVVSYFLLGGKCRYCKVKLGLFDTFTEVFGGIMAVVIWNSFNVENAILNFAFLSVLYVVAMIDKNTMEIPDGCHVCIFVLALISFVLPIEVTLVDRLIGLVCISLPMLLVDFAVPGGFGGGDIKLMAVCGLFLGWQKTVVGFTLGVLAGGTYGSYLLITKKADKKDHFAFGPFLCCGLVVSLLYGYDLVHLYLTMFLG